MVIIIVIIRFLVLTYYLFIFVCVFMWDGDIIWSLWCFIGSIIFIVSLNDFGFVLFCRCYLPLVQYRNKFRESGKHKELAFFQQSLEMHHSVAYNYTVFPTFWVLWPLVVVLNSVHVYNKLVELAFLYNVLLLFKVIYYGVIPFLFLFIFMCAFVKCYRASAYVDLNKYDILTEEFPERNPVNLAGCQMNPSYTVYFYLMSFWFVSPFSIVVAILWPYVLISCFVFKAGVLLYWNLLGN